MANTVACQLPHCNPLSSAAAATTMPFGKSYWKTLLRSLSSTGDDGTIDTSEREQLLGAVSDGYRFVAADLEPGAAQAFYQGYPNQTVWPLFHYFPTRMNFSAEGWAAYQRGNRAFCRAVSGVIEKDELIWVHDYHLMLLPECIREQSRQAKIGFFLHIPFPSPEVFAMLPHREDVLRGMLGADRLASLIDGQGYRSPS